MSSIDSGFEFAISLIVIVLLMALFHVYLSYL